MSEEQYERECNKLLDFIINTFEYNPDSIFLDSDRTEDYIIKIDEINDLLFLEDEGKIVVGVKSKHVNTLFAYRQKDTERSYKVSKIIRFIDERRLNTDVFESVEGTLDSIMRERAIGRVLDN